MSVTAFTFLLRSVVLCVYWPFFPSKPQMVISLKWYWVGVGWGWVRIERGHEMCCCTAEQTLKHHCHFEKEPPFKRNCKPRVTMELLFSNLKYMRLQVTVMFVIDK